MAFNKRLFIIRVVTIIVIIGIVFLSVCFCENTIFVLNDPTFWRIRNFYKEDKESLDVVIIGSSEVQEGFYSGMAFKEFGITSYPFALDSSSVEIWKSQLNEVNNTQSPQLIVVEISGVLYAEDEKLFSNISLRRYLDNIPFSINKIETIGECVLEDEPLSYIFPIIKYHGQVSKGSLTESLHYYNAGHAKLRGAIASTKIDNGDFYDMSSTALDKLNNNAEHMLVDFLEYCKKNQFGNIVFTRFPQKAKDSEDLGLLYRKNSAKEIIAQYGFPFIDCDRESKKIGIDYDKDFYDSHHLNVFGAEKLTFYFSNLFIQHFGVKAHTLKGKQYDDWTESSVLTDEFIKIAKKKTLEGKDEFICENKALIAALEKNR